MELVRNGWHLSLSAGSNDQCEVELYVYTGAQTTDRPATPTATILTSCLPQIDTGSNYVNIDLAPYIMDEMDVAFDGGLVGMSLQENGVWFDYRYRFISSGTPGSWVPGAGYTQALATPGFVESPTNDLTPSSTSLYLISPGTTLYIPEGIAYRYPINNYGSFGTAGIGFYNGTSYTIYTTFGSATDTNNVIQYQVEPGDTESINYRSSNVASWEKIHDVKYVADPGGLSKEVYFMNKYGAIQTMYFFGRTKESIAMSGVKAKRNTVWYGNYRRYRPDYVDFYKNGIKRYTVNSGWQVEANNTFFEQLLASEQIWYEGIPVRVVSSSLQLKTGRWDKVINYTIEFESAKDYMA